jgi:hypothetical protein
MRVRYYVIVVTVGIATGTFVARVYGQASSGSCCNVSTAVPCSGCTFNGIDEYAIVGQNITYKCAYNIDGSCSMSTRDCGTYPAQTQLWTDSLCTVPGGIPLGAGVVVCSQCYSDPLCE